MGVAARSLAPSIYFGNRSSRTHFSSCRLGCDHNSCISFTHAAHSTRLNPALVMTRTELGGRFRKPSPVRFWSWRKLKASVNGNFLFGTCCSFCLSSATFPTSYPSHFVNSTNVTSFYSPRLFGRAWVVTNPGLCPSCLLPRSRSESDVNPKSS